MLFTCSCEYGLYNNHVSNYSRLAVYNNAYLQKKINKIII